MIPYQQKKVNIFFPEQINHQGRGGIVSSDVRNARGDGSAPFLLCIYRELDTPWVGGKNEKRN